MDNETAEAAGTSAPWDAAEILDRARAMTPRLRERAEEARRLRRLPDATIEEASAAGIFNFLMPRSIGGAGGGLRDFVALILALARGDISSAWALGFLSAHSYLMARYPLSVQQEVFREGAPALMAMSAHPPGKATPVEGGYEVSGYWGYCSGVMHSDWVVATVIVEGRSEVSLALFPRSDVEVQDTWQMSGLQGTGSNDIKIVRRFVPAAHVIGFEALFARDNAGSTLHDEVLYGFDARDVLSLLFPTMAVGAAEALLDDYRLRLDRRRAAFSGTPAGDTVAGQIRFARAASSLRLAQAALKSVIDLIERANAQGPEPLSHELRAQLKLDCLSICRMAWESVEIGLAGSGSAVFRSSDPTPHVVRDLQVLLSHMTIDQDGMHALAGEILLGRATGADPSKNFT